MCPGGGRNWVVLELSGSVGSSQFKLIAFFFFYLLGASRSVAQTSADMCGSTTSGPLQVADSAYAWGRWTSESIWSTMASLLLFALDVR